MNEKKITPFKRRSKLLLKYVSYKRSEMIEIKNGNTIDVN